MNSAELLLTDLALVLSVAAVVSVLFRLVRQPPVLGYLLAGMIVGPHLPIPLFADLDRIRTLSELGVILVMFAIGLEFSLRRLIALLPTSGLTGAIQLSGMMWLGYLVGQLLGWTGIESLFAGSMIAVSSTMIVSRTLSEQKVDKKLSDIVFGVLIVQDLAAVLLLAVLTAIATGGGEAGAAVANTAGELALYLVGTVVVGYLVVPRAIRLVARLGSDETLLIASVGLCFASSLLAHELGYSVALGSFLAGSLMSESGSAERIERMVVPLRDLFAAVFFISVGMIVDPRVIADSWLPILALTALVLVAQTTFVAVGTFLTGQDLRSSIRAGMSLAQIGEFSFLIAGVGVSAGAIRAEIYPIAVAVCVVTSFTTPWMVKSSTRVALAIERRLPHPVQTFTTLYASWREELRQRGQSSTGRSASARIRRLVLLLAVDGAILTALPIVTALLFRRNEARIADTIGVEPAVALVLVVLAAATLAVPFVIGLLRVARALGTAIAAVVLPRVAPGAMDLAAAPRRAFVVTLQLGMALIVGLPFLAVTAPFLPSFLTAPVLAGALILLGLAFWRNATNLEEHVQAGAHLVVETLARHVGGTAPPPDAAALGGVEEMLPGLGHLTPCRIEPGWAAVGTTLVDLNLRGLTGASVIAIMRREGSVAAPTGREVLEAGDLLGLTGTSEAVEAAGVLLRGERVDEVR
ncbi:MAG TPA: cation:proton antiporter [Kofleriaceae bacterium]|nr:cation:proton antiporter [Kofleriaceae bacterium]